MRIGSLSTGVPLYIQIAESLLGQIESGELVPGDRLPPERELSRKLGVNRMTLRKALQMIEGQGLLVRQQGVGTYVSKPKIERKADHFISFTKGMERRGFVPGAKVLLLEQRPAKVSVAQQLQLAVSAPIYYSHRLRFVNSEATMLERFALPAHRLTDFESHDLANRSLYEVLETEYDIIVQQAHQSLEAVSATEYEAELFDIDLGAPLILEQRLTLDQNGTPIEFARDLYRGDRFKFVTEMALLEM